MAKIPYTAKVIFIGSGHMYGWQMHMMFNSTQTLPSQRSLTWYILRELPLLMLQHYG